MIEMFGIKNFKSLRNVSLKFGMLTLLAGLNGAGKSSVIQALLLLHQSYHSGSLQRGFLQTSGAWVDLGDIREVLSEQSNDDWIEFDFRAEQVFEGEVRLRFDIVQQGTSNYIATCRNMNNTLETLLTGGASAVLLTGEIYGEPGEHGFQYVPAERAGPRKYHPRDNATFSEFDLGPRSEHTLHVINEYNDIIQFRADDPRLYTNSSYKLREQLEGWLGEISPGVRLDTSAVSSADLVVGTYSFGTEGELRTREYRATNVGFGLSYVLPVIAALLGTAAGGLVLIENPEAHLHPQGQTKLGELCARAAAAGVQIIVETHSDHFMDGIRIAVREKLIPNEDVIFHYFSREQGATKITTPTISPDGKLSSWPDGFFDQHRRNIARLIRPSENA